VSATKRHVRLFADTDAECWRRRGGAAAIEAAIIEPVTPVEALERAVHYLDRAHVGGFKTKAFVRALDVLRSLPPEEVEERSRAKTLTELDGIGDATARLVAEALAGGESSYLAKLEAETRVPLSAEGAVYRDALRGDCHLHSRWSDGGATIEAMVATAVDLGHEYLVLTDHSPRLTIAHGLDRDRLEQQLDVIAEMNRTVTPFRILTGMEVDILEDGALDLDDDLLQRLDVVVASVHSKLRMERTAMTQRMVQAVASPHVDILGHCTGRLIGKRPESTFDPDYVFAACARFHTAVEINCRPERLDPPRELLQMAVGYGCWFSIDSDAHATGQLEWQPHGCDRAAECEVPIERVINTMPADELLQWARAA
jgi:putative hydrolase